MRDMDRVYQTVAQASSYVLFKRTSEDACATQPISGDQLPHHAPVHVGQPEVAAGVTVCELFVIEAQEVQDRGVQVVDVDAVLDRGEAKLVGAAVDLAAFDA